jgi:Raf kinase inhibitor-like YbhB/YbcL family protein
MNAGGHMTEWIPITRKETGQDKKIYQCGAGRLMPQKDKPSLELTSYFFVPQADPKPIAVRVMLKGKGQKVPDTIPAALEKKNFEEYKNYPIDWYYFAMDVAPAKEITIEILAGNQVIADGRTKASIDLNAPSEIECTPGILAPQFSKALVKTKVTKPSSWKLEENKNFDLSCLNAVLKHIWKRLNDGPDGAWLGDDAYGSIDRLNSPNPDVVMEERWARSITRILVLTSYSAPFSAYKLSNSDGLILAKAQDETDPGYPITFACEQLSSMGAISRGYRYPQVKEKRSDGYPELTNLIGFAVNTAKNGVSTLEGKDTWISKPPESADELINNNHIGPCSIFARGNNLHVAFLLRVSNDKKQFQFFDTGGMATHPAPEPGQHNSDYKWSDRMACKFEVGTLEKKPAEKALSLIQKARPLGFARLIITRNKKVLFATPLLRMHCNQKDLNFPLAAYLWSLRQIPYKGSIQASWAFYIPLSDLAFQMIAPNSREKTVRELFMNARKHYRERKIKPDTTKYPNQEKIPGEGDRTYLLPTWINGVFYGWVNNVVYLSSELDTKEDGPGTADWSARRQNDPTAKTYDFAKNQKYSALFNDISNQEKYFPCATLSGTLSSDVLRNTGSFGGLEYFLGDPALTVTSAAFCDGDEIPQQYTCKGDNVSPPLSWSGAPQGTQSFVVLLDDPDATAASLPPFSHWVVYNIPSSQTELAENVPKIADVPYGRQGKNDFSNTNKEIIGYAGPCPPGDKIHHYFFKVFALDQMLDLKGVVTRSQVMTVMKDHILDNCQLIGLFT